MSSDFSSSSMVCESFQLHARKGAYFPASMHSTESHSQVNKPARKPAKALWTFTKRILVQLVVQETVWRKSRPREVEFPASCCCSADRLVF